MEFRLLLMTWFDGFQTDFCVILDTLIFSLIISIIQLNSEKALTVSHFLFLLALTTNDDVSVPEIHSCGRADSWFLSPMGNF